MNKYERTISLIKVFLAKKEIEYDTGVYYGEEAARINSHFDPETDGILLICPSLSGYSDPSFVEETMEEMFDFLRENGIEMDFYDNIDNSAKELLYDFDHPFTNEGKYRREKSLVYITEEEEEKIKNDLIKAHGIAIEAAEKTSENSGTFNFDYCVLTLKNYREGTIERICKSAGVSCYKSGNSIHPEYYISGMSFQRHRNTVYCEKMADELGKMGYKTRMYYRMD